VQEKAASIPNYLTFVVTNKPTDRAIPSAFAAHARAWGINIYSKTTYLMIARTCSREAPAGGLGTGHPDAPQSSSALAHLAAAIPTLMASKAATNLKSSIF